MDSVSLLAFLPISIISLSFVFFSFSFSFFPSVSPLLSLSLTLSNFAQIHSFPRSINYCRNWLSPAKGTMRKSLLPKHPCWRKCINAIWLCEVKPVHPNTQGCIFVPHPCCTSEGWVTPRIVQLASNTFLGPFVLARELLNRSPFGSSVRWWSYDGCPSVLAKLWQVLPPCFVANKESSFQSNSLRWMLFTL